MKAVRLLLVVAASFRSFLLLLVLLPALAWGQPDDSSQRALSQNNASSNNASTLAAVTVTATVSDTVTVTANVFDASSSASAVTLSSVNVPGYIIPNKAYTSVNLSPTANSNQDKSDCDGQGGDPVIFGTGTKVETVTDFAVPGEMGLKFQRIYNSSATNPFITTAHWKTSFDYMLDVLCGGQDRCAHVTLIRPDGSTVQFLGAPDRANATFTEQGGSGLATLYENADYSYTLHDEDGSVQVYSEIGQIQSITSATGVGWTYAYSFDPGTSSNTTRVTHTNGQSVSITMSGAAVNGVLYMSVTDPSGNVYSYQLNSAGDYTQATLPGSPATVYNYKYDNQARLTEIDINGAPYAYTTYNASGYANATYLADGSQQTSIVYTTNATGVVATITNPLGHVATNQYDNLHRLTSVTGTAVVTCGSTTSARNYDANSNLSGTSDNNGVVHTYSYAANGQLQTETEAYGTSVARTTDYVWDPNVQLNRVRSTTIEGWSKTAYTFNAQNRLASKAVTNLSGTGTANQTLTTTYGYTLYGNGMVHTMSVTHPSPNNSNTDIYTYDALGNLTSLANGLGQTTTYSNYNGLGQAGRVVGPNGETIDFSYDARGRIATKTTYPNGSPATWTYAYDGYGLPYTLTGPDGQVTTWNRDARLWVSNVTHNDKDGTSTESFSYDVNGDVIQHTVTRGSTTALSETIHYDALGRVYQKLGQNGESLTYTYDGNGNVLSTTDAVGHVVSYQYDALNRATRITESGGTSPSAPTLTSPGTSTSGGFTVSWTTIPQAVTYNLQEQVNSGAWSTVSSSAAINWSTSGRPNGTYGYQVRACYTGGCGPWSTISTTTVLYAPGSAPTITTPANNTNGSYTVSWTGVATATSYNLQEQVNGGGWAAVQSSGASTWGASGKGNGTYGYRVQACNSSGCGPWSSTGNTTVLLPPGAPTLSTPINNTNGSYTVSWTTVSTATSYTLQEQVNGGAWNNVQSSAGISWGASGKANGTYGYRVQACNVSGCSGWSGVGNTTVLFPPSSAPSLSVPGSNTTGSYTVSWSGVATASSYTLQERVNGGGWTTVQANGAGSWGTGGRPSGSYGYQVQACNASGCGPWSAVATVTVLLPPSSAPPLYVPSNSTNGSYTISWNGVTDGATYTLQEQINGGGWTTVQANSSGNWSTSGRGNGNYGYHVQACNASGCGPWSGVGTVTVLWPPPPPASVSAPSYIHGVQYYVSWSASATATSYNVMHNGAFYASTSATSYTIPAPGMTDTIQWGAQACNASGCSATTNAPNVTNTDPPGPIH